MLVFTTRDSWLTLFLRLTISVSSESSGHCTKAFLRSYPVLLNMISIDLAQWLQYDCILSSQKMLLLCRYPASCSRYLAFFILLSPSHSIFRPRDLYSSHITSLVSTGTLLIILYVKPILIPQLSYNLWDPKAGILRSSSPNNFCFIFLPSCGLGICFLLSLAYYKRFSRRKNHIS